MLRSFYILRQGVGVGVSVGGDVGVGVSVGGKQFNAITASDESSALGERTWIFADPVNTNGGTAVIFHVCGATFCVPGARNVNVCTGPVTLSLCAH